MSDEFDPIDIFRRARRRSPRVIRSGPVLTRGRRILLGVLVAVVLLIILFVSLIGLRVQYLFLDNLGHSNVFWTPLVTKLLLFLIGFLVTGGLVAVNIPFWMRTARTVDQLGATVALIAGAALAVIAGLIAGAWFASHWEAVLLWMHGRDFGRSDPVFHEDYGFFIFRLPVYDAIQGLLWGGVIVGLLGTIAAGAACVAVELIPEELPVPLQPPPGVSPRDGLRVATAQAGVLLVGIFVLAAAGAHFGVYHLATSQHESFVGLDATQRDVSKPVLQVLQFVALGLAVLTAALLWRRRNAPEVPTAIALGGLLGGWLIAAGLVQAVPAAIYSAAHVNPNASTVQLPPISDYLATSRDAWALQPGSDVDTREFGSPPGSPPTSPTVSDLTADALTLLNTRIQDTRQLSETFAQIDRARSYQTYPGVSVDRYPGPDGGEVTVMLGTREIEEANIPQQSFVNRTFTYTHGYGVTAASVNLTTPEGNPVLFAGGQPQKLFSGAPPGLAVEDPRIYCGLETTQPVVVNTTQAEFDYVGAGGDQSSRFGDIDSGLPVPGAIDRLAISLNAFGGLDLFLTSQTTAQSRILLHRDVRDRIAQLAPFLRLDGDPYPVADPTSGHFVFIVDAYVDTDLFPEAFRLDDGTSYMRNAVKAVVDARTCATTLYAVDLNEPLTAAWSDIYPGLFTPLSQMPDPLRAHLRYPKDLFSAQARVFAAAHIDPQRPIDLFNKSDLYRIAQEASGASGTMDTRPYYAQLALPGESQPRFVLLQTFSPAITSASGNASNVMTAWFAAESDYTSDNHFHPRLVDVTLNGANVLGPLQFDQNLNTNTDISKNISLLNQRGSSVILGNVIVLPFNDRAFLYVRPLYVSAASGNFPQLKFVLVGTRDGVAMGSTLADALRNLFGHEIPGLPTAGATAAPSPGPSPGPSPSAGPSPGPGTVTLSAEEVQLLQDLLQHQAAAQQALARSDLEAYGREQAIIQRDVDRLRQLLGPGFSILPSPSATPAPSPSP